MSWGPGGEAETVEQYRQLTLQMNLYYQAATRGQEPPVLEQGQVPAWGLQPAGPHLCSPVFPPGVCGVLVGGTGVVSGQGGVALRGLGVPHGQLPAGGPRGTRAGLL